jgi:phenylalanyl-tRNA synthetase beta chain
MPTVAYTSLPRYPAVDRDIAVVVDDSIKVGEISDEIKKVGTKLLERVDIFDVYRGKQLESGEKSIAFSLVFRSFEGSLKGAEVDKIQKIIANHIKKCFNADIREG